MSYIFTITEVRPGFTVSVQDSTFNVSVTDQNVAVTSTDTTVVVQSTTTDVTIESNATVIQTKSLYDTFQGTWSTTTNYLRGDFVRYNDSIWLCSSPVIGTTTPNLDPNHWELLAVGSVYTATSGVLDSLQVINLDATYINMITTATMDQLVANDASVTHLTVSDINGLQFPSDAGINKQVLTTNGAGTLYWSTVSSVATASILTGSIELKDSDNRTTFYANSQTGIVAESNSHYIGVSNNTDYRSSSLTTSTEKGLIVTNEGGINDPFYDNTKVSLPGTGTFSDEYPFASLTLTDDGASNLTWSPTYWYRPSINSPAAATHQLGAQLTNNTGYWNSVGVTPPSPLFNDSAIMINTHNPALAENTSTGYLNPGWVSSASTASNVGTGDFTIEGWSYVATPKYKIYYNLVDYPNGVNSPNPDYVDVIEPLHFPKNPILGYAQLHSRGTGSWNGGVAGGLVDVLNTTAGGNKYRTGLGWQVNLHMGGMFFEAGNTGEESTWTLSGTKQSRRFSGAGSSTQNNGPYVNYGYWDGAGRTTSTTTQTYQARLISLGLIDTEWLTLPLMPRASDQVTAAAQGYDLYNDWGFDNPDNPTMPYDEWFHWAVVRKDGEASIFINGVKQKLWKQYYGYLPSDPDIYSIPFTKNISVTSGQFFAWGPTYFTNGTPTFSNSKTDYRAVEGVNFVNAAKYTGNFTPSQRTRIEGLHPAYRPVITVKQFQSQLPLNSSNLGAEVRLQQARGDFEVPTGTANTDIIGNLNFQGHTGSDFQTGAKIQAVAIQDWTTSTQQTKIQFKVVGTNTNALSTPVEITHNLLKLTGYGIQFPDGTIQTTAGGSADPNPGGSSGGNTSGWDFGTIEIPSGATFDGGSFI